MEPNIGKLLVVFGLVLAAVGLFLWLGPRLPFGELPGDLTFQRGRTTVRIPLGTSLLISVVLTVVLNLILRLRR